MDLSPQIVALPFFVLLMALELLELRRERRDAAARGVPSRALGYERKDTATSVSMGIGSVIIGLALTGLVLLIDFAVYEHRVLDLGSVAGGSSGIWAAVAAWVLLVLLDDFLYYWMHRANHRMRFFWACHVQHHSSQRFNLSTALRQPWQESVAGLIFFLPLFFIGFTPAQWAIAHGINLIYQFWLHTEAVGTMWRPIELVLNTPSHHRVHHGSNAQYIDKNYGGMLIVFDRWFGTFEPEVERVVYGLIHNINTHNPFRVAFHEYYEWCRDLASSRSWRERWGVTFGAPGWRGRHLDSRTGLTHIAN